MTYYFELLVYYFEILLSWLFWVIEFDFRSNLLPDSLFFGLFILLLIGSGLEAIILISCVFLYIFVVFPDGKIFF